MRVEGLTDRTVLFLDKRSQYVFPKPTPYLLDTYEGAAAAYSLRRLRSAYTGPAVRVRRASNNDELDIYFNRDGSLDTATLEAFCAGTNGFVKVWFDQGQEGNDAEQTTTANQPQIVSSGSVVTENGQPALAFDGSDDFITPVTSTASDYTMHAVTKNSSVSSYLFDSQTGRFIFDVRGTSVYYDGTHRGTPHTGTAQQLQSIYAVAPSSGQSYVDGTQINTGLGYVQKALGGTTRLGGAYYGDSRIVGTMQEFVLYASDQSANRTGIEDNINEHYSIYP
jgi:hypothetical protein